MKEGRTRKGRERHQSANILTKGNFIMSSFPLVVLVNKLHSGVLAICLKPQ